MTTTHSETRRLPYSVRQMYDLVADVGSYPDFLPWTQSARVRSRRDTPEGEEMIADLVIAFKVFRERYTSRVTLVPPEGHEIARVDVVAIDGPFRTLKTLYRFEPDGDRACRMHLDVEFAFRSRLMQKAAGVAFDYAIRRVSGAFEERARAIYGPPAIA